MALHDLRLSYCEYGVALLGSQARELAHLQFTHVTTPLYAEGGRLNVRNALLWDVGTAFSVQDCPVSVEHLTLHECQLLAQSAWGSSP